MTDQAESDSSRLIRYSEILRQQVLDSQTLEPLGRIETLWMYPQVNRVLGVVCKPTLFGPTRLVIKLPQVQSMKTQILVEGPPEKTIVSKVEQLESLIGTTVWTDEGEHVGRITDCLFDLTSGVIIRYLMVPEGQMPAVMAGVIAGLTEGIYLLSPKQIRSFSKNRVLIADDTVQDLRLYSEGLRLKLAQLSTTLKQDYWQGATEEWESFASHLQTMAAQAKERLMTLAEKAREKAQTLSKALSQTITEHTAQPEEEDDEDEWGQAPLNPEQVSNNPIGEDNPDDGRPLHQSSEVPETSKAQVRNKTQGTQGTQTKEIAEPQTQDTVAHAGQRSDVISEATEGEVFDVDDWELDDWELDDWELDAPESGTSGLKNAGIENRHQENHERNSSNYREDNDNPLEKTVPSWQQRVSSRLQGTLKDNLSGLGRSPFAKADNSASDNSTSDNSASDNDDELWDDTAPWDDWDAEESSPSHPETDSILRDDGTEEQATNSVPSVSESPTSSPTDDQSASSDSLDDPWIT